MIRRSHPASDEGATQRLSAGIVGGGIGGMAAAAVLQSIGVDVTVFEQSRTIGEIGAGLTLTPNSVRLLRTLPGVMEQIDRSGARLGPESAYRRKDGAVVAPLLIEDSSGLNGSYGMHRADLLAILAGQVLDSRVLTNTRFDAVRSTPDGPTVVTSDGSEHRFDLLVGADGIHSTVRAVVAEPDDIEHSGVIAYRGLISLDRLPGWPADVSDLWMGDGKHFLTYPVRSGSLLNYVGFVPSGWEAPESWSAPGDVGTLREAFKGWDPRIRQLLDQVDATYWWSLNDRRPLDRWSRGAVTVIGDAAHPMLPHLGQGANQAIEDAFVLADCLAGGITPGGVPAALAHYEWLRRPRATMIQRVARETGQRFDGQGEFSEGSQRDAEMGNLIAFRQEVFDFSHPSRHDADLH